jgi:predicted RNA binding protein YcfA (HicA-like mRNA interferase family)
MLKVRDIIKLIENDGWYYIHSRGSHRKFRHSVKKGAVTIAGKPGSDLHPEIINSILKQAQIVITKNNQNK